MKTLYLVFFTIISLSTAAQDPHFSHIHASPLNNNPAWTGVYNANFRIISNYRNQWKTPTANFNTFSLSFEGRYIIPRTLIALNGGIAFLTDNGGDLKYGTNNYNFLGGMTVPIGGRGKNFITVGTQLGLISHHIDLSNIQSIDEEPLIYSFDLRRKTIDLSAGIGYYLAISEVKTIYAGFAMYHINQPDVSLIDNNQINLYKRYVANAGAIWEIKNKLGVEPSLMLYWQGPHREITVGGFVYYKMTDSRFGFKHDTKIHAGIWGRYYINSLYNSGFDALIFSCRYDVDNLSFSFSSDLTLSRLVKGTAIIGSPELSFIYTFSTKKIKHIKSSIACPAF